MIVIVSIYEEQNCLSMLQSEVAVRWVAKYNEYEDIPYRVTKYKPRPASQKSIPHCDMYKNKYI